MNIWIFPSPKPDSSSSLLLFLHSLFREIAPPSIPANLKHHTKCFFLGNGCSCLASPHSQFSIILHKFLSILSSTHLWNLVTWSFFPYKFKASCLLMYYNSLWISTWYNPFSTWGVSHIWTVFPTLVYAPELPGGHVKKKKKDYWAPLPVLVQQVWGMAQGFAF